MEKKLFNEPKQRLKDGRYCSDEQKRIEMSIDRCKLLEMQLQTERRKVIALTERDVMREKKYKELVLKLKELVGLADVSGSFFHNFAKPKIEDLQKVSEIREKILILIHTTDIHEDIIEHLLEPFENLLIYNGVNLQETDY